MDIVSSYHRMSQCESCITAYVFLCAMILTPFSPLVHSSSLPLSPSLFRRLPTPSHTVIQILFGKSCVSYVCSALLLTIISIRLYGNTDFSLFVLFALILASFRHKQEAPLHRVRGQSQPSAWQKVSDVIFIRFNVCG